MAPRSHAVPSESFSNAKNAKNGSTAKSSTARGTQADTSISHIVVEHKDRCSRFGVAYIQTLLKTQERELVIVNEVEEGQEFTANLNPNSLEVASKAKLEPSLANASVGNRYQFERIGYFCVDYDSKPGTVVFNRTVALKDTWAKMEKRGGR